MIKTDSLRCWAEVDCAALRHNAKVARGILPSGVALMAVIKANGYGHGLSGVAEAVADEAQLFGVANLQEALQAREVVPHPILIMGPALPAERAGIVEYGFIPSISSHAEATEFSRVAGSRSVAVNCAIDTGMGRMGLAEIDAIEDIKRITAVSGIELHSVSTHLPSADEDAAFTAEQLERFARLVERLRVEVPGSYLVHALPSAGMISFGQSAFDLARAGLML